MDAQPSIESYLGYARDHAGRHEYTAALVYFESALEAMNRHILKTDDVKQRRRWQSCAKALEEEAASIKERERAKTCSKTPSRSVATSLSGHESDRSPLSSPTRERRSSIQGLHSSTACKTPPRTPKMHLSPSSVHAARVVETAERPRQSLTGNLLPVTRPTGVLPDFSIHMPERRASRITEDSDTSDGDIENAQTQKNARDLVALEARLSVDSPPETTAKTPSRSSPRKALHAVPSFVSATSPRQKAVDAALSKAYTVADPAATASPVKSQSRDAHQIHLPGEALRGPHSPIKFRDEGDGVQTPKKAGAISELPAMPTSVSKYRVTPVKSRRFSHTASHHDPEVWLPPPPMDKTPHAGEEHRSPFTGKGHKGLAMSKSSVKCKVSSWRNPNDKPGRAQGIQKSDRPDLHRTRYDGPDQDLAAQLERDILEANLGVAWTDIAGLEDAKAILRENCVLPLFMPDFFKGIRRPVKGIMMFGPPGTGKTMLAKAIATECQTTFFNVSAATLASKYRGESERMVRLLFEMAREWAPTIIFIDEIDSLCSSRGATGEHEASRRVKTEILIQIDGIHSQEEGERRQVMVLAATNFPWDVDEALRRRLEKRVYIPLPGPQQREELMQLNLRSIAVAPGIDFKALAKLAEGYSGDDIAGVCRDSAMASMRRKVAGMSPEEIRALSIEEVSDPVNEEDFKEAIRRINPSVSTEDVKRHEAWMKSFGSI